jgi:RNA polymerase sigma factor (sigma-70 family)
MGESPLVPEKPHLQLAQAPPRDAVSRGSDELLPLVARVLAGDGVSVRTFIATISGALLRVVRGILGAQNPDAEDVLQESLVAVMEALPRFRGEGTVLHFACRVAVLTAMNARRRQRIRDRGRATEPPVLADLEGADQRASASDLLERRQLVLALLDELPEPQAEVLALHCALGYTVCEIAAVVGISPNTVRGRLVTAKQVLRTKLQQDSRLRDLEGGTP